MVMWVKEEEMEEEEEGEEEKEQTCDGVKVGRRS